MKRIFKGMLATVALVLALGIIFTPNEPELTSLDIYIDLCVAFAEKAPSLNGDFSFVGVVIKDSLSQKNEVHCRYTDGVDNVDFLYRMIEKDFK